MQPTWWDHRNLNFWPWACLQTGKELLSSSQVWRALLDNPPNLNNLREWQTGLDQTQRSFDLRKYQFVMTAGSLAKHLTYLIPMFPNVQPAYDAADHFRKEALYLRNMVEHSEVNVRAAQQGKPRGGFARQVDLLDELPGDKRGIIDATAVIIQDDGHWLGGRLNVERVISEVTPIFVAAQAIPPPVPTRPQPPPGAASGAPASG